MKIKTLYVCQNCGTSSPKWLGRCTGCGQWNTLVEEKAEPAGVAGPSSNTALRDEFKSLHLEGGEAGVSFGAEAAATAWTALDAPAANAERTRRLDTGMKELNRVLGGGLVPDSFTLLGGDPGIGKSTLLLQMAKGLLEKNPKIQLLYVSGEESVEQIRSRADRLNITGKNRIFLAGETQLERVFSMVKKLKPHVLVMDSLQTFSCGHMESAPGSVGQVREVTAKLLTLAKSAGISIWLVGHVTKDGNIAGPKVVEHMVDTVLYFESDPGQIYRLLRTVKNRFGGTHELGVFEMNQEGLQEVLNPSSLFLSERQEPAAGIAISAAMEGSRPLLVELQALVVPSGLAMPRRTSVGIDASRISLLAAILERHSGLTLSQQDLFFNVAGGLRLTETASDLAAAAAIWSSKKDRAFPQNWIFVGELGLTGEVRRVSQLEIRIEEAKKLGFKTAIIPKNSHKIEQFKGIELVPIKKISELEKLY